jgi:hypothetical protein
MDEIYRKLDTLQASTSLLADTYNSDVQITESGHALFGNQVRTPIINGLGTTLTTKVNDVTIAVANSSQIDFQGKDLVNIGNVQSATTTSTEIINVDSNLLIVNAGQTGVPVSTLISGIEVERGTSTNYQFVFRESDDTFCIGEKTNDPLNLQAVLTREADPYASGDIGGVFYYNGPAFRADTDAVFKYDPATQLVTVPTISSSVGYKLGSNTVLSGTTLGSTIVSSSLTSIGTQATGLNIATGQTYKVNGTAVLSSTTLGSTVTSSSLTSATSMNINAQQAYAINFVNVLSSTTLGYGVVNSGLTSLGTQAAGVNIATGQTYKVDAVDVLSATTLGVNVVASSLTSVGVLSGLAVGGTADALALATFSSTTKGLLIPRMTTTQKNAITGSIPTGLLVYDTTLLAINHYNGSAWSSISSAASNPVVVSINNTNSPYSLTTATDILVCTASSGAITINLPTAVGNSGKVFRLTRTDTTLANAITINATSSQTIGGFAIRRMWTINETWQIVSDGANWQILSHEAETGWIDDGVVVVTATTTNPTKGTMTIDKTIWRRVGSFIEVRSHLQGSSTTSNGSGDYLVAIPQAANIVMDSTYMNYVTGVNSFSGAGSNIGEFIYANNSTELGWGNVIPYDNTRVRARFWYTSGGTTPIRQIWHSGFGLHNGYQLKYSAQIAYWDA